MRARCIKAFRDLSNGGMRQAGEEFEATAERIAEINGTRYGQLVEAVEETRPEETVPAEGKADGTEDVPEQPEDEAPEAAEKPKRKTGRRTPTKRRTPTTKE